MSTRKALLNELRFAARDRALGLWMAVVLILSILANTFGLKEVDRQHRVIANLIAADRQERMAGLEKYSDWGSAAYYSFHLTYDPPSALAFAAMGQRDEQPWKHRIRMLALEGQIYERDVGNPSAALIGRFDFAFLAAFVFPLILILLLYDLRESERTAGRYNLLASMAHSPKLLWRSRAVIRAAAVSICLVAPMVVVGCFAGTGFITLLMASLAVLLHAMFWGLVCYGFSAWRQSGSLILMTLVGAWALTAVIVPASARLIIDRLNPLPSGADILLLQRETVNDAWDLPRAVTMQAFIEAHPQWADYQPIEGAFEWPWYYAFQQVGDQKTAQLSKAYRAGREQRDRLAGWVSLLAPPALLERSLQGLAKTDLNATLAYESRVRSFHAALRQYYYPKLFLHAGFDKNALGSRPEFNAGTGAVQAELGSKICCEGSAH